MPEDRSRYSQANPTHVPRETVLGIATHTIGCSRCLATSVAESTVDQYRIHPRESPSPTWRAFLDNHIKDMLAIDFFKRRSGISAVPLRPPSSQPKGRESAMHREDVRLTHLDICPSGLTCRLGAPPHNPEVYCFAARSPKGIAHPASLCPRNWLPIGRSDRIYWIGYPRPECR